MRVDSNSVTPTTKRQASQRSHEAQTLPLSSPSVNVDFSQKALELYKAYLEKSAPLARLESEDIRTMQIFSQSGQVKNPYMNYLSDKLYE